MNDGDYMTALLLLALVVGMTKLATWVFSVSVFDRDSRPAWQRDADTHAARIPRGDEWGR